MALDYKELRYPSLALLGLCVAKALLVDTSSMELPYRVASFLVLGGILVATSMLYVRTGKHGKEDTPAPPR